jgi:hypothetical protein
LSIRQAITAILDEANYSDAELYGSFNANDIPKRLINIDKAFTDFGWKPK